MKSNTSNYNKISFNSFLVLIIFVLVLITWMIFPYILSITMGAVLAIISKPFYFYLLNKKIPPKVASLIVTLGLTLMVILPFLGSLSLAVKQGMVMAKYISQDESFSIYSLVQRVADWKIIEMMGVSVDEINSKFAEGLRSAGTFLTQILLGAISYLPQVGLQLVLVIITFYFLLLDGDHFYNWMQSRIPIDKEVRKKVGEAFKNTAIGSIWATLSAGFAQSLVMFFGYLFLGIPAAFLAGAATFIFSWIPIIGSSPVWIIGSIYLFTQGFVGKVIVMIILGLLTSVVDNVVRPFVLKGRSDLHPLVSLIAIFGGINVFGIIGVFLGPILASVLISLFQIWPSVVNRSLTFDGNNENQK